VTIVENAVEAKDAVVYVSKAAEASVVAHAA
jgi:hypothetical protein